jgi:hypothetical protein
MSLVKTCTRCDQPRLPGSRSTWCREHKAEWQRANRRKQGVRPRVRSLRDRLFERAVIQADGCVFWDGPLNDAGYGYLGREGGRRAGHVLAHVAAWELLDGLVPEGLELDHLCFRPACIAPVHLEPVTHLENVRRARERLLQGRAGKCPQGHDYDAVTSKGYRRCLTCNRESQRRARTLQEV